MVNSKSNKQKVAPSAPIHPKQKTPFASSVKPPSPKRTRGAAAGVVSSITPSPAARTKFINRIPDNEGHQATVENIVDWIYTLCERDDKPNYGINVANVVPNGTSIDDSDDESDDGSPAEMDPVGAWLKSPQLLEPIFAHRLTSFVVGGNNSNQASQDQLADLFTALCAPQLETAKILRPGRSTKNFESALYRLLSRAPKRKTLTKVCLEMRFCWLVGLQDYLASEAASHLTTLHLRTNANVKDTIVAALVGPGHRFPNLCKLSVLDVPGLSAQDLLQTLSNRRELGHKRRLIVNISDEVTPETRKRALAMNIVMMQSVVPNTQCSTMKKPL
ncbi:hypothetical protein BD626DRAFT_214288 [Schizophyllum amplum]|uniref:Uncharacterized protein n=1 Tax=Schizophyllum amplum TaxID=97359 RepID=A0A550CK14_9AGAR|nr:hypothetical protein BD626DRAFT_214288 [Auriculariopsis ampla]